MLRSRCWTGSSTPSKSNHVLTLSPRYFFLPKPPKRRLNELARKYCGQQQEWRVGLETLGAKSGSGSTPKELKRLVGNIIEGDGQCDQMPDYAFAFDAEVVTVRPKKEEAQASLPLPFGDLRIRAETYEDARKVEPRSDVYGLDQERRPWVLDRGIEVRNPDAHLVSFCKRHAAR